MADSDTRSYTFGTLVTAMVTPFTSDGEVDYQQNAELANKLVDDGNDALVISGTTGETSTLEDDEKEKLFRASWRPWGTGPRSSPEPAPTTPALLDLSQRAAKAGADGLLIVTPYYNKPNQAGIQAHFEAVASATDLPVMLYDIPGRSGMPIVPETIIELAEHPNIVALKDAKADFAATTGARQHRPGRLLGRRRADPAADGSGRRRARLRDRARRRGSTAP